jgi:hypothetical protein
VHKVATNAPVSTDVFLDSAAASIAGVLFAAVPDWNLSLDARRDLAIVHNAVAARPLSLGVFPARRELWFESGWLRGVSYD